MANERSREEQGLPTWWVEQADATWAHVEDMPTLTPVAINRACAAHDTAYVGGDTRDTGQSASTSNAGDARAAATPSASRSRPVMSGDSSYLLVSCEVDANAASRHRRSARMVVASSVLLVTLVVLLLLSVGGLSRAATLTGLPFFRSSPHSTLVAASRSAARTASRGGTTPHASATTSPAPNAHSGPVSYPIAALSPSLATYLQGQGPIVGVSIYDLTRNHVYSYNDTTQFLMGSSAKIPIMLEYFQANESQGASPSANDEAVLSAMIENSDNDAAQDFYSEFGYDAGLSQYLLRAGDPDFTSSPDGFGWFAIAPRDMTHLLSGFYEGKLTNTSDRAYGLSLLENIEPDQQEGVGDTAPSGATVAMKDGWIQGPDGAWAANSSGIVRVGGETYIISVYTQEIDSLGDAYAILNTVCQSAARSLDPPVASAIAG